LRLHLRLVPLTLLTILVGACGPSPAVSPGVSTGASVSASSSGDLSALQVATAGKAGQPIPDTDINREQ
jgi:hypothetical protein